MGAVEAAWRPALATLRAVSDNMRHPILGHIKVREHSWLNSLGVLAGADKLDMARHTGTWHTRNMWTCLT